jgi:peroxiredoxin
MPLTTGQSTGDFTFLRPDGSPVKLSELRHGPLVLIFLRHLA